MNQDQMEGKWKQLKGSVRERWGKLTDNDIDVIGGRKDKLIGVLQERYGIAREDAEKQFDTWFATLDMQEAKRQSGIH